ncbi:MAG: hypothetical protein JW934_10295 [Anaerolineae bacterium]|nr:hypothetical protein [Anaerolineae bacterium]
MTVTTRLLERLFSTTIQGTPWWMTILVIVEFVMVIIGITYRANEAIGESAYCETHRVWYTKWKRGRFSVEVAEAVVACLQTQDAQGLENIAQMEAESYPHLIVQTRGCPSGPICDVEITGTAFWQVTTVDKRGKSSTETKSKSWFDVMVPAAFGYAMERQLGLQENPAKKR